MTAPRAKGGTLEAVPPNDYAIRRVAKLMDFGAFVTILPGKDELVHISQISDERAESVSDKLREGNIVKVKVLEIEVNPERLGASPLPLYPCF